MCVLGRVFSPRLPYCLLWFTEMHFLFVSLLSSLSVLRGTGGPEPLVEPYALTIHPLSALRGVIWVHAPALRRAAWAGWVPRRRLARQGSQADDGASAEPAGVPSRAMDGPHGAAPYFERRDGGAVFIVGAIGTLRDGQGEPLNYGAHARPAQPAPRARRGWVRSQPWWCAGKEAILNRAAMRDDTRRTTAGGSVTTLMCRQARRRSTSRGRGGY